MTEPKWQIKSCRSCKAAVIWTTTPDGKAMPVDAVPDPVLGNIELTQLRLGVRSRVVTTAEGAGREDLRTSHFATCEQAASWRKS